jgi:hypothetical protein
MRRPTEIAGDPPDPFHCRSRITQRDERVGTYVSSPLSVTRAIHTSVAELRAGGLRRPDLVATSLRAPAANPWDTLV